MRWSLASLLRREKSGSSGESFLALWAILGHNRANNHSSFVQRKYTTLVPKKDLRKTNFQNQKQFRNRNNSVHVLISVRLACWLKILSFRIHGIHRFMVNIVDSVIKITEELYLITFIRLGPNKREYNMKHYKLTLPASVANSAEQNRSWAVSSGYYRWRTATFLPWPLVLGNDEFNSCRFPPHYFVFLLVNNELRRSFVVRDGKFCRRKTPKPTT